MITIDGSEGEGEGEGEGGGQVLRYSAALSLLTGEPFTIQNIRGGRAKPGLMRQHVTALEAACAIGGAECSGLAVGSSELTFRPGSVTPGEYHFAVGTAGSVSGRYFVDSGFEAEAASAQRRSGSGLSPIIRRTNMVSMRFRRLWMRLCYLTDREQGCSSEPDFELSGEGFRNWANPQAPP